MALEGAQVIQTVRQSCGPLGPLPAAAKPSPIPRPRIGERRKLRLHARLTWHDAGGALRFVSGVTRDVSDVDVFVECQVPASIPLYRLVHFQVERTDRQRADLPAVLRQGKVLSAVYRIGPYGAATGTPQGYALRLLTEPCGIASASRHRDALAVTN